MGLNLGRVNDADILPSVAPPRPPLLTESDVAKRLSLSLTQFRRHLAARTGAVPAPSLRLPSGEARWESEDVEQWLDELKRQAKAGRR